MTPIQKNSACSLKRSLGDVTDIKEDKAGRLWLISNPNLFSYDQQNWKSKILYAGFISGTVSSIAIAADNTIWVSTSTGLIKKYDYQV